MDNKISVVICTRDRADHLRRCLCSLINSKNPPHEVVVVDQSCNGHTIRVIREFSAIFRGPLRYIRQDCTGHTKARNAGVSAACGDIVAFTDDDCVIDENWLDSLNTEFTDPKITCVCGQTLPANHANRPKQALLSTVLCRGRKLIKGRRNPVTIGKGNNMAFRRMDLLRLGGFNEEIGVGSKVYAGDDTDLFYRLLLAGGAIVRTSKAIVLHTQPDDWHEVIRKKRGYSISAAAVLASRARYGDMYAALLLGGKLVYEFGYLFCGGALRFNRHVMTIGWHSFAGSVSGIKYITNETFCEHTNELQLLACESYIPSDEEAYAGAEVTGRG